MALAHVDLVPLDTILLHWVAPAALHVAVASTPTLVVEIAPPVHLENIQTLDSLAAMIAPQAHIHIPLVPHLVRVVQKASINTTWDLLIVMIAYLESMPQIMAKAAVTIVQLVTTAHLDLAPVFNALRVDTHQADLVVVQNARLVNTSRAQAPQHAMTVLLGLILPPMEIMHALRVHQVRLVTQAPLGALLVLFHRHLNQRFNLRRLHHKILQQTLHLSQQ